MLLKLNYRIRFFFRFLFVFMYICNIFFSLFLFCFVSFIFMFSFSFLHILCFYLLTLCDIVWFTDSCFCVLKKWNKISNYSFLRLGVACWSTKRHQKISTILISKIFEITSIVLVPYMDSALNMDTPNIFKSNKFYRHMALRAGKKKAVENII